MNKRDTAYEGIERFCAEQGFNIRDTDLDKVCALILPSEGNSLLAIKLLREITRQRLDVPMVLKYDGPFKQFMVEKSYDTYKIEKCLGLVSAKDIVVFLRDNGFGTAQ